MFKCLIWLSLVSTGLGARAQEPETYRDAVIAFTENFVQMDIHSPGLRPQLGDWMYYREQEDSPCTDPAPGLATLLTSKPAGGSRMAWVAIQVNCLRHSFSGDDVLGYIVYQVSGSVPGPFAITARATTSVLVGSELNRLRWDPVASDIFGLCGGMLSQPGPKQDKSTRKLR